MLALWRAPHAAPRWARLGRTIVRAYTANNDDGKGSKPSSDEFDVRPASGAPKSTLSLVEMLTRPKQQSAVKSEPKIVSTEELKRTIMSVERPNERKKAVSLLDKPDRKQVSLDAEPLGLFAPNSAVAVAVPVQAAKGRPESIDDDDLPPIDDSAWNDDESPEKASVEKDELSKARNELARADEEYDASQAFVPPQPIPRFKDYLPKPDGTPTDAARLEELREMMEYAQGLRVYLDHALTDLCKEQVLEAQSHAALNYKSSLEKRCNVVGAMTPPGEETFEDHMNIGKFIDELELPESGERALLERARHELRFNPTYTIREKEKCLELLAHNLFTAAPVAEAAPAAPVVVEDQQAAMDKKGKKGRREDNELERLLRGDKPSRGSQKGAQKGAKPPPSKKGKK